MDAMVVLSPVRLSPHLDTPVAYLILRDSFIPGADQSRIIPDLGITQVLGLALLLLAHCFSMELTGITDVLKLQVTEDLIRKEMLSIMIKSMI